MTPLTPNGWDEWGRHVLAELKRLSDGQDGLKRDVHAVSLDVRELRVRAGVWGMVGGALVVVVAWLKSSLGGGSANP